MNKRLAVGCILLAAWLGLFTALPAKAASLQLVTNDWGATGAQTNLALSIYVPDNVVTNPPILVLLHYWGGTAASVFGQAQAGGIVAAADQYGFIMLVPTTTNPPCWDVNSSQTLTHDGGGQTHGVARMVRFAITNYHANANRVYVTGDSCGGGMTEAMLAVYPDLFKAGAAFAGQVVGGAWAPVTHTAQEWGNIVRAAYPGYSGPRPRVQLWHGTADDIISYSNHVEAIMQWGNVLGLSVNPTTTTTLTIGSFTNQWTHQTWEDSCGNVLLDAWAEYDGGHGPPDGLFNAQYVIPFLGLDHVGPSDPVTPCTIPSGLSATVISSSLVSITWKAFTNAASYNVKRSATSGGPYTPVATGITATNYTDTVTSVVGGYYYVVSAMVGGSETFDSIEAALRYPKLTGGIIGTPGSWGGSGNTIAKVFDNDLSTFFDAPDPGNGDWAGLDFGSGVSNVIARINYCPRAGFESRMVGGVFQGANQADFSGAVMLATVATQPAAGWLTPVAITNAAAFRYVRYLAPNGGYGNVAEVEFNGYPLSTPPPPPPAPGGPSAAAISSSQINLSWNASAGAVSYNVKRSTTNGGPYTVIATGVTATNYNNSGLAAATTYYYVVNALNAGGESANSAQAGATTLSGSGSSGTNPIVRDAFTADPAPLVVGDTVYLYTGHDVFQSGDSGYHMDDWRCYSSQDMTNWTSHGTILSYTNFTWASGGAWAGHCVQKNGKFYWYVPIMGNGGYGGFNIGVAVSDHPTGPFVDARGTPLITDGMTTGGDAWDDIDPAIFTDTNGVSWLGWGHGTFYLAPLATNMTELAGPIQAFRNLPYFTEGPWIHRRGDLYYLSYASIDGGAEKVRYATAPAITGPWTPRGLITGYANSSYTIHNGIIDFKGQSYFFYHNGVLPGGGSYNRSVCVDYLYYNPDGTIQPIIQTTAGVSVPPRNDNLPVGVATQAWPANGATNIPWGARLRWLPGSNAVAHAVYVGTSSNAVAQAAFASPEYLGTSATTNFSPTALAPQTTYFWRVDEIRGTNLSRGAVGSFSTGPYLAHRYSFNESGGSMVADSAGGPAWAGTLPNGGALGGGQLTLSSSAQQHVRLPAGVVGSLNGLTIMAWVNLSSSNNWNRLFDFGNGTTSYMYLTPQRDGGTIRFSIRTSSGGEQTIGSSATVSTGAWHQVAVSLSGDTGIPGLSGSGGSGGLYLDGVRVGSTEDLTLNPMSLGNTANNYIGKSQFGSDPYLNGALDEFRVYSGMLTAAEIARAWFVGPSQVSSDFPWLTQDVGPVGVAGGAAYSNGVFTLSGSGSDIWNTADAFRYVYVPVTGNCVITARVVAVQHTDPWAKAGVMIRESLNVNAANAFIAVTPSNGVSFQYRSSTGGNSANNNTLGLSAPHWVRLVRSGNSFSGYRSVDGVTWVQQGSTTTIGMASAVYAGLAVTAHNNSSWCAASFDNVSVPNWSAAPPPAVPTGLVATAVSSIQINVQWNASSNATSYTLKRSLVSAGPYTTIASGLAGTNYSDSALSAGTTYYYAVSAVNGAGESTNSAPTGATTLPVRVGSLVHRYSFSEAGGTTAADAIGGPAWAGTLPNGGIFSSGQLALAAASSNHVSLPAGIVSSLSNITLMAWVNLSSNATWNRIFDFGDNTTRYMFLTPQIGGIMRFAITTNGNGTAEQLIDSSGGLSLGAWHQVAVTLSAATGRGVLYLNGVAVGTNSSMTLNPASMGSTVNNYLGRSQWPDPYMNGMVDEFRVYSEALSGAEIAATQVLGPDEVFSTNSPQISITATPAAITLSWPLAAAGFTVQSRTNLIEGDWVNATSPAPQIVGNAWLVTVPSPANAGSIFYRLRK